MATTTQIIREAPEIEALKRGLIESAKGLVEGYTIDPVTGEQVPVEGGGRQILPTQQIAGFDPLQQKAFAAADPGAAGIGGYKPYMATGTGTLGTGLGTMGTGLGTVGQAAQPLQQAQQALYGSAGRFTGDPGYTAGQFAGESGYTAGQFAGGPGYTAAGYGGGPGYTAAGYGGGPGYEAGGFDPQSVSAYMDPYEDAVIQQAMSDIRRQGDIAQQGLSAQAVGAGAFGGSRQGIQQNEMNRNILEQQARTAAGLRSAGYQGAMGQAQQAFEAQQRRQQAQAQFGTQAQQQAFEDQQRRQQAQAQFGTQAGLQGFEAQQRRQQAQAQFGTQSQQQAFEDQQRRAQAEAQFGLGSRQRGFEDWQRRQQAQAQFGTQSQQQAFENQQRRQQQMAQLYGGIGQLYGGLGAQQAGIGAQQAGVGAQQLGAAQLAQATGLRDISTLAQFGGQQQALAQAQLDATRGNLQRQQFEPYGRLGFLSDIYKGAPSTTMSLGSQLTPPPPQPSTIQQFGSLGVGLLGTQAAMKQLGGGAGGGGLFG